MRQEIRWIPAILLLSTAAAVALAQATSMAPAEPPAQHKPVTVDPLAARGQVVFSQNCSRCHTAPESFSPRISGSVSKHMRVRANMSDADTKALLHFLNP